MTTKICKNCGIEKSINEFNKRINKKYNKFYVRCECRNCEREYSRNNSKKYYNSEHGKQKQQEYLKNNREKILEKNKIRTALYRKEHYNEIKEKSKIYREKNREKINKYFLGRYKDDYLYRFKNTIRNSIRMSFKRNGKLKPKLAKEILCCDINFLIDYLIKTYEKNYNEKWDWEYVKEIHIDHIIPLATAKTEEDIIKLCHYTNLQLLKAEDNLKKSNKTDYEIK